jgi:hypothetical protein
MTTVDVLDKRLTDLETIVWDIPVLLTTRTAKYEAEFTSISGRLDKIERNQGMLQVDMRDLRNGVARFMVEFDARMRALEDHVAQLEAAVEKDRSDTAARFDAMDRRFDTIDATLAEILRSLPKA